MEWMYKGVSGLADREDYLTGRKVDKTFEIISAAENPTKGDLESLEPSVPQSVFDPNQNQTNSSTVTIDLAAKLREDPLYEIRVKQREQRRKLLDNPLKLKKLKNILESTLNDDKHKKHKKSKKKRHNRSSDTDSDDSDDRHNHKRHRKGYERNDRHSDHSYRHKSYESNRDKDRNRDQRDSKRYDHRSRDDRKERDRPSERRSDDRQHSRHSNPTTVPKPSKTKLSAEELEQRRREMVENAVWREVQRKSNVQSYEEEEKKEIEFNSSAKSAQFIKPLLKSAAESDSLEDRIKQKRFRTQRGYHSMDNNFAKK